MIKIDELREAHKKLLDKVAADICLNGVPSMDSIVTLVKSKAFIEGYYCGYKDCEEIKNKS